MSLYACTRKDLPNRKFPSIREGIALSKSQLSWIWIGTKKDSWLELGPKDNEFEMFRSQFWNCEIHGCSSIGSKFTKWCQGTSHLLISLAELYNTESHNCLLFACFYHHKVGFGRNFAFLFRKKLIILMEVAQNSLLVVEMWCARTGISLNP